ncbi:MAG: hypothetical protein HPY66_3067 [Firmicutes bacterium]|nr:hypothetical protein [Bacillota bacterium]
MNTGCLFALPVMFTITGELIGINAGINGDALKKPFNP